MWWKQLKDWWSTHAWAFIMGWYLSALVSPRIENSLVPYVDSMTIEIVGYIPWALLATFIIWTLVWWITVERPSRRQGY